MITVQSKITFPEYLRLMYIMSYRNRLTIYITFIGLMMLTVVISYYAGMKSLVSNDPIAQLLFAIFILIVLPLSIRRAAKKTYSTNLKLQETIEYQFTGNELKIIGETFSSELRWVSMYKIVELNDWFLIYADKQIANTVPKKNMTTAEVNDLRELLKCIPGNVIKKLK